MNDGHTHGVRAQNLCVLYFFSTVSDNNVLLSVPIAGMLATMAVTINSDRGGIGFTAAELGRDYILLIAACALIAILIYFANRRWIDKILKEASAP